MNKGIISLRELTVIGALSLLMIGSRAPAADLAFPFIFELRVPTSQASSVTNASVSLAQRESEDGTFLWACKRTNEAGFAIFQQSFLLFSQRKGERGFIVTTFPTNRAERATAYMFRLSIAGKPRSCDWTPWKQPDYTGVGDEGMRFVLGTASKSKHNSTNKPSFHFELRYKIEKGEKY
jgi:hypothetical protein